MTPKVGGSAQMRRNNAKGGSVISLNNINFPNIINMKTSFHGPNEEVLQNENHQPLDYVDQSFELALREAKKSVYIFL